jgi:RNA polymerase sigma-70 factor, ECF subfamily
MDAPDREFIYQLTDWQNRLFGYLVTLLGDLHDARDVLQETNLVLWQKIGEFEPGSDFGAWARKIAYFQALAFLRDRKRDRHLFDDELLARFAEEETDTAQEEEVALALRDCLARLPTGQRKLVSTRYREGGSIKQLARVFGKKESAIKMTLMRIRQALLACVELKLKEATA